MARRMQRAVVVLPQPLSPTSAERLALVDVKVDAVHGAHVADRPLQKALPDRKELLQAGDPEQRRSAAGRSHPSLVEEAAHGVLIRHRA